MTARYRWLIGYHPLGYLSWFCYSSVLVAKIVVIFKSEIINFADSDYAVLGSQMMTLNLGFSALVFFLLVKGHHDSVPNSYEASYISSLIQGTTLEIFDSTSFLSVLYVDTTDIMFSYSFENVLIAFACINFILPNICFYKLSYNDYGQKSSLPILSLIYKLCHLFLVNIPYMVIRIYLWITFDYEVSIFLAKNIILILQSLIAIKSDGDLVCQHFYSKKSKSVDTEMNLVDKNGEHVTKINIVLSDSDENIHSVYDNVDNNIYVHDKSGNIGIAEDYRNEEKISAYPLYVTNL